MAALVLLGKLVKSLEPDAAVRAAGTLYFYLYAAPAQLIAARNRLGDLCASHLFLLPAAIFLLFSIQWTEFGRNNAQITDGFRTGGNIAQDVLSGYFLIFTGILLVRKTRPPSHPQESARTNPHSKSPAVPGLLRPNRERYIRRPATSVWGLEKTLPARKSRPLIDHYL